MPEYKNPAVKYLKPDHTDFEFKGKPALVLCHLQNNLVGAKGTFEQIKKSPANTDYESKAERDYYWQVIDEMEYDPERDIMLTNFLCNAFNDSGPEHCLHANHCDTIVWAGFSNQAVIYCSSIVAADKWFNNVIPVDATFVYMAPTEKGFHDGVQEIINEAFVGFMEPQTSKVTNTDTVIEKITEIYGK